MGVDLSKAVELLLQARRSGVPVKPPFALPDRAGLRLEGGRPHADR